jgi:hypothetical protein
VVSGLSRTLKIVTMKMIGALLFNYVYVMIHGGACGQAVAVSVPLSFC